MSHIIDFFNIYIVHLRLIKLYLKFSKVFTEELWVTRFESCFCFRSWLFMRFWGQLHKNSH